ncbi:hypothetical protein M409DRAFT_24882 [Zasmidium cellare ATCC 36951]|uniref:Uncharacterized protein n=1 Tax=Zasmidium cellare ATCC 36951 TaxID=1080233 RepID=A0A6A6CD62_ZASCE|nr:uncharacterized protein M409DRAFT_24882 [Zasmidium cellare ATCC 36951]KAF2164981.1 hypothetical protein M409DRAFT_24882 [Zasmidium cellare ATCC 36951]
MTSNVGNRALYEDGDQKNVPQSEREQPDRFKEGQPNSHKALDSKDERSIANKLAREEKRENEPEGENSEEARESKIDSTLPARMHGNEPSKGAKIDQQLKEEEEAELKKKGAFGPK